MATFGNAVSNSREVARDLCSINPCLFKRYLYISFDWTRHLPLRRCHAVFKAIADDEVVGFSGVVLHIHLTCHAHQFEKEQGAVVKHFVLLVAPLSKLMGTT